MIARWRGADMKFNLNLRKQEVNLEADVEKVAEKHIDYKAKVPRKKTRYQIKQEEKRKNLELQHKLELERKRIKAREDRNSTIGLIIFIIFVILVYFIASVLGL
jgi:hypothetical protein